MSDDVVLATNEGGLDAPGTQAIKDTVALENLRIIIPRELEKEWRLNKSGGLISPQQVQEKNRTGKRHDYFNPRYDKDNPCPYPVKKNANGGWGSENVRPCGHMIKGKGKEAQADAVIHCELNHFDWWFETESEKRNKRTNGEFTFPTTTRVTIPKWHRKGGPEPGAGELDVKIWEARQRALKKVELQEQEAQEELDRLNDNLPKKKRGRPKKEKPSVEESDEDKDF
jgi:hypothetical protein